MIKQLFVMIAFWAMVTTFVYFTIMGIVHYEGEMARCLLGVVR